MSHTDKALISIVERSQKISDSFNNVKGLKEFLALIEKYKSIFKEVDEESVKRKRILSDLEKAERSLAKAQAENAVEVQKLKVETQELNKANKAAAQESLGLVTTYQKFAKEVNEAKNKAKNLGAEMIELEQRFKKGEITKRAYNAQLNKLSKEFTEAKVKALGLDTAIKKLDKSVGDNQRNVGNYKSAINGIAGGFKNLIAAFGVVSAIDMFADLTRKSYETVKVLNAQNLALKEVFETENQVAYQKEFLSDIVNRYGLELTSTTASYTKFSAAVKGSSIEGEQARAIFESFSGASSKLGLSADETAGIFKALEQMISKGKIQAEELRGQLGDRMSGSFRLFAAAMGVSTAQLDAMLKSGEVLAEDVLPKVSNRLNETWNLDKTTKIDSVTAAQNRLTTVWTSFLDDLASDKGVMDGLADAMEGLGVVLEFVLDTLFAKGTDGISVIADLGDILYALFGIFESLTSGVYESFTGMDKFRLILMNVRGAIGLASTSVTFLIEQLVILASVNFDILTLNLKNLSTVADRMKDSAERAGEKFKELREFTNDLQSIENGSKTFNEVDDVNKYKKAYQEALKAKKAYFQHNGNYFATNTGKNTGKSVNDYIDKNIEGGTILEKKTKEPPLKIIPKSSSESAGKKLEQEQRKREREAEKQRKLAYENAKAEIEAQKLSLDFIKKSFKEENHITQEKEVFYSYYYNRKAELLEKERDNELKYAESAGERNKILQKYNIDEFELEEEKQAKIKAIRVQSIENEKTLFEAKNQSALELGIELTDALIENEKKRLDTITDLEIKGLEAKLGVKESEVLEKVAKNQLLTDNETEFYAQSLELHRNNAESKSEIDTEYYEQTRTHLENAIEIERLKRGELYEGDTELRLKHATDTYDIEIQNLEDLLEQKKITQEEFDEEAEIAELEHQERLHQIRQEAFSKALLAQGEFVENANEIDILQKEFKNMINWETEDDYLQGLSKMAKGLKSFAKEGSATWKALASFQATLNMFLGISKAITEGGSLYEKIIGVAFATTTGLLAISKIASTPNPAYKEGTLFAQQSGIATTDEEGPELHFDRNWRLKDKGSSGGARQKYVAKGDKILPTDISKMITKIQPPTIIDNSDKLDYDKLASKIAEKGVLAQEKQKKEFFLIDPETNEIIKIESKKGMTIINRKKPKNPTGQELI